MCFSLQISLYAAAFIYASIVFVTIRNKTNRERWAAMVMFSAAPVQLIDFGYWLDVFWQAVEVVSCAIYTVAECTCTHSRAQEIGCLLYASTSDLNSTLNVILAIVLSIQPCISLGAAWRYSKHKGLHLRSVHMLLWIPYIAYTVLVLIGMLYTWGPTRLSEDRRILWGGGNIGPEPAIIHTVLLVLPFLYCQNRLSKVVWIMTVFAASLASYTFSDSFGSMWCFFTVLFAAVALLDPYLERSNE